MSYAAPVTDEKLRSEWAERYALARDLMVDRDNLMKQYLELPIVVQHAWEGYPVVDAALVQLEQGWFLNASLLADATYTDDRVAACTNTRTNAPFSLDKEFKYQGEEEESEDDEEIIALKKSVRDIVKKYWDEMLPLDVLREWFRWGLFLNLGIGENVWDWHPVQLQLESKILADMTEIFMPIMKTWNPQNVYWRWDTRSFWLIHQSGQVELNPGDGRWVTYSPQGHNHGWLYGMIRQLGKLWLDRIFTYRDWARAEEKFALGIILAEVPAAANPQDKQRFEDETADLPPEATVTVPALPDKLGKFDLRMLDTQQVGTGWEIFDRRADKLDRNIAILMLGQNLTTESQSSGSGSSSGSQRGNSKVQDSVRKDYLKSDCKTIEHAIKTQLLAPFVEMNFAGAAEALGISWRELIPEVTFQVEPPQDTQIKSKAFNDAALGISAISLSPAGQNVDYPSLMEKLDIPTLSDDAALGPPPPGDSTERPRAPLLFPSADPDQRISAGRAMPRGMKRGGRDGQRYVDKLSREAKRRAAAILERDRESILKLCREVPGYREKKQALVKMYAKASSSELRELMRQVLVLSNLSGQLAAKIDAQ